MPVAHSICKSTDDEQKLGEIVIGLGSFTWYGPNRRKPHSWSWTRFAALMNSEAYGE